MFSCISYPIKFGAFTWRTWAILLGFQGWYFTLWLGARCDVEGKGLMFFPFLIFLMFCHCSHMFFSEEFFALGGPVSLPLHLNMENKSRTDIVSRYISQQFLINHGCVFIRVTRGCLNIITRQELEFPVEAKHMHFNKLYK